AVSYSTYVGRGGSETAGRLAVDSTGSAYITGGTSTTGYPASAGAYQNPGGNAQPGEGIVTKLNATGNAVAYPTHLGGTNLDLGLGIALDSAGNVYVTGTTSSTDFPVTPNAFQRTAGPDAPGGGRPGDCFVSKLNPTGDALLYSTYLGGSDNDVCS